MHTKLQRAKEFIQDKQIAIASAMAVGLMNVQGQLAHATSTGGIKMPKVEVGDDGTVTIGDKAAGASDLKTAWSTMMGNSTFVLGAIAMLASLLMIGSGLWLSHKAAKDIQSGNPSGWSQAGNIAKGTIVGGILLAVVGLILASAAATGANLFSGK